MRLACLAALALTLLPTPAVLAQTAPHPVDPKCWYASKSFGPGSRVRIGEGAYLCMAGSWTSDTAGSANCYYEDRLYSTGALVAVGKETLIACDDDGTWAPVRPTAPAAPARE